MSQNPNIIQLNSNTKNPEPKRVKLPAILETVRESAKTELTKLMAQLFDHTDDALFEMADRSSNDDGQSMYFESMRQFRLCRSQIIQDFTDSFLQSFDSLLDIKSSSTSRPEDMDMDDFLDNISLVENEELEITVALNGMSSKITSLYSLPIMQLTRRIDSICPEVTVTEHLNPLGPQNLGRAFVVACECLNIKFKVFIYILKLFEQFVMEKLDNCYANANTLLIDAGILPELKSTMVHRSAHNRGPISQVHNTSYDNSIPASASSGQQGSLDQRVADITRGTSGTPSGTGVHNDNMAEISAEAVQGFAMLQALLAGSGLGESSIPVSTSADTVAPVSPVSEAIVNTASTTQLLSTLNQVQAEQSSSTVDLNQITRPVNLHKMIQEIRAIAGEPSKQVLTADDDTINLVGMLFDCILNDRNLAIPMKALISRLQIPFVKIAIVDKSFFTKTSHPARQLLNQLSSSGIGWSSAKQLKRDALYTKIENTVLGVLDEFDDDISVIEKLVQELLEFVKKADSRTEVLETRVKEAETGKALTSEAKLTVQNLINQKASGLRLPSEIGKFVSEVWSRALVYTWINEREQSKAWQSMVSALDELLWSVQPLDSLSDMDRRDRLVDELCENLAAGIRCVVASDSEVSSRVSAIGNIIREISSNDRAFLDGDELEELPEIPRMEEILLTPASVEPGKDWQGQNQTSTASTDKIAKLREGSWVEFLDEQNRLKLTTIIEPGGKYIFVNQRGMKVSEESRLSLASMLEAKRLIILDESQVFDRALQSVIGNLRHMHRNKGPNPA